MGSSKWDQAIVRLLVECDDVEADSKDFIMGHRVVGSSIWA